MERVEYSQRYIPQTKACRTCYGSGKIMGGGMIKKDCPNCAATGKREVAQMADAIERESDDIVKECGVSKSIARKMIGESLSRPKNVKKKSS